MARIDRLAGAALALFSLGVMWEDLRYPLGSLHNPGPGYMPMALAAVLLFLGVLVFAFGARSAWVAEVGWTEWRHALAIFAVCAFAALALERIGYRLTVGLSLAFLLGILERKSWIFAATFAVVLAAATYFLFDTLLRVPLPRGPFGI